MTAISSRAKFRKASEWCGTKFVQGFFMAAGASVFSGLFLGGFPNFGTPNPAISISPEVAACEAVTFRIDSDGDAGRASFYAAVEARVEGGYQWYYTPLAASSDDFTEYIQFGDGDDEGALYSVALIRVDPLARSQIDSGSTELLPASADVLGEVVVRRSGDIGPAECGIE